MNAAPARLLRRRGPTALVSLLVAMACVACSSAHYAVNAPRLAPAVNASGYAFRNLQGGSNSDSLVVILALSGGGYRAAALAHAVMAALERTPIRWEGRRSSLLDEVDVISAVSGGSLAAAYYAVHRASFVRDFPLRVLAVDMQSLLLRRSLSPLGLWRQTSNTFGRGDLLQEVLDEQIFHGQRFAQLPRIRPMVYINATDMRHGQRFEFTQDQFDLLCSDLDALPLSRAVAASMAVPVLLSPITVWNHSADCVAPSTWHPLLARATGSRYIHLVDGGLADNTGLNAVMDTVTVHGGLRRTTDAMRLNGVRKRVIILVNAQVSPPDAEDDSPHTPGLLRQLRSLIHVPIDRHSDAKVEHLSQAVRHWQAELREAPNPADRNAADSIHVVEVSLSRAIDPASAKRLQSIPTGLHIEPEQIEHIRQFVHASLAANPEWRRLLADIGEPHGFAHDIVME